MFAVGMVAAITVGFLGGLLAFRIKNRWCPQCGGHTVEIAQRRQDPDAPGRAR